MLCIDQPHLPLPCFPPCGFDAFFRDIKPGELASWKGLGHKVDSVTLTTPYVKHACAFLWLGDQPFDKLDYLIDKPYIKNTRCFFCLQLLELSIANTARLRLCACFYLVSDIFQVALGLALSVDLVLRFLFFTSISVIAIAGSLSDPWACRSSTVTCPPAIDQLMLTLIANFCEVFVQEVKSVSRRMGRQVVAC
jgi:hypothetical protein